MIVGDSSEPKPSTEPQRAFRHVNDSIRELAIDGVPTQTWEFVCECGDMTCHAFVSLTLVEFDRRRATSPPVPILAAHDPG